MRLDEAIRFSQGIGAIVKGFDCLSLCEQLAETDALKAACIGGDFLGRPLSWVMTDRYYRASVRVERARSFDCSSGN